MTGVKKPQKEKHMKENKHENMSEEHIIN